MHLTERSSTSLNVLFISLTITMLLGANIALADKVVHPRLLLGPDDIPKFRKKLQNEPFKTEYENLKLYMDKQGRKKAQIGALVYAVEADMEYAAQAKDAFMNEIRSWDKEIPRYRTAYRNMLNICIAYDLLQPSSLFSADEQEYVKKILSRGAARMMERGNTFNLYDYFDDYLYRQSNTDSDRLAALGIFLMTFPDHLQAEPWLRHVLEEFRWQMERWILPDGACPEGTRYHGAVMRQYIPFAHALKRNKNINLFEHPGFKMMFENFIQMQTPRDATLGGAALTPGIHDSNWESIWEAVLGWGTSAYKDID